LFWPCPRVRSRSAPSRPTPRSDDARREPGADGYFSSSRHSNRCCRQLRDLSSSADLMVVIPSAAVPWAAASTGRSYAVATPWAIAISLVTIITTRSIILRNLWRTSARGPHFLGKAPRGGDPATPSRDPPRRGGFPSHGSSIAIDQRDGGPRGPNAHPGARPPELRPTIIRSTTAVLHQPRLRAASLMRPRTLVAFLTSRPRGNLPSRSA